MHQKNFMLSSLFLVIIYMKYYICYRLWFFASYKPAIHCASFFLFHLAIGSAFAVNIEHFLSYSIVLQEGFLARPLSMSMDLRCLILVLP